VSAQQAEALVAKIAEKFVKSRREGRLELMPFIPAGYPTLEASAAAILAASGAGAGLVEVGIPFSDPIADGPVIQEAFTHALARRTKPTDVLAMVRDIRAETSAALVAMVSYSIVFRRGVAAFADECVTAGFDGIIIPDLPSGEADRVCPLLVSAGLDTVLLAAPSTPPERRARIAELSSGFVYYLSVAGITGARDQLPEGLIAQIDAFRGLTNRPVCVGFGLSRREHLDLLRGHADGAIVGSALVRRMRSGGDSPGAVAAATTDFCRELLG
jgi:tryptophan synthase alpha chain